MDVRIETAPMVATAAIEPVVIRVSVNLIGYPTLIPRVVSFSCPSIAGHSLSAVAPGSDFMDRRLALGVAA